MVSNDAKSLLNSNNPEESENRLNSQSKEEYVIYNNFKLYIKEILLNKNKLVHLLLATPSLFRLISFPLKIL